MKQKHDHLDDLKEWQDNQFNPGHYIGNGKMPPYIKAEGNYGLASIPYFIAAISGFVLGTFLIIDFQSPSDLFGFIALLVMIFALSFLFIMAGINYLRKIKAQRIMAKRVGMTRKRCKKKHHV